MPIRNLLVGLQADPLVEATALEAVRFISWKSDTKDDQEEVKEYNATHVMEQDSTQSQGEQQSELQVELYFDQLGVWLTMRDGAPVTTTDPGGAIGTKKHLWKRGISTPKAATFWWFDGITWRKSINNVLTTFDVAQAAGTRLKLTMKFMGFAESEVAAPVIPAFAYAAYNHPISATKQQFKLAGVANASMVSSKWSYNNNRKAHYGTQPSTSPNFFEQGEMTQHADVDLDFLVYAGSLYAKHKSDLAPGSVEYLVTDTGSTIGTGTPTNPSVSFLFSNPKAKIVKRDFSKPTLQQTATLFGRYDTASASYHTTQIVNEKAAGAYTGS